MLLPRYDEIWSHPGKSLSEHLKNVGEIAKASLEAIPLCIPNSKIIREVVYLNGLYHDAGKATSFFQGYLRENNPDRKARLKNMPETNHSLISAIATCFAVNEHLENKGLKGEYFQFLPIASFLAVRRHHTNLQSAAEDLRLDTIESLKKQVESLYHEYLSFLPYWSQVYKKLNALPTSWELKKLTLNRWLREDRGVLPYIIQHLLYSLLLDADKHEVTIGSFLERKDLPKEVMEIYCRERGFFRPSERINILRNEIYQKVVDQVETLNLNQNYILSLTAPTGSGKTLTTLAFAIALRNRIINEKKYCPRIIYSLPFLSIIDQNAQVINELFKTVTGQIPPSDLFLIHHHLADYTYKDENTEYETDESEILIEGWDSEIIITTFVQLFHTLFSNKNKAIRKFHKIAGSIIILDEIQSLPHEYWLLFRETAEALGKYFNTYFILSTATQPVIFNNPKELVSEREKYFKSFKRTQITVNIASPKTISDIANEIIETLIINPKNTMIVLNTIKSAENLFEATKEPLQKVGYEIYFLSSHVTPFERLKRIKEIKDSASKKIVISTQLVEAGVDIDLERVIRDLGPFDSINQVAGRANRNLKTVKGEVEVVLLKDEHNKNVPFHSYIYDPILIDNTKNIIKCYSIIDEEEFLKLTSDYYQKVLLSVSDDLSREYLDAIRKLDYEKVGEFELIKQKGEKVDIFVELDDSATTVWEKYQELVAIRDPIMRKQRFLKIRGRFYQYVISVLVKKAYENLPPEISGIRFISKSQLNEYYDLETGFKDSVTWIMQI